MNNQNLTKKRIFFLDELRGLAVFCMIFYHAFFIIGSFLEKDWAKWLFDFFLPVEPFFAGIFIFICGVSCTLSRSNFKRGIKLLAAAGVVTLVTVLILPALGFEGMEIYFGILHFLAVAIMLFAIFSKTAEKTSPFAGLLLCAVLYAFTSGIGGGSLNYGELIRIDLPQALYEHNFLMPLGIYSPSFFSADYFPIFPDIFIFFAGAFAGFYFASHGYPEKGYIQRSAFFGWLGRRALIIYIAHMPLIFALAYAVEFIINLF